jgi:hypothetical protein
MKILKIRMTAENQDDFVREFDIKANATFKALHDFIVKNLKLDKKELASFFISDDYWNKNQEITLVDMMAAGTPEKETDKDKPTYLLMDKVKLEHFINDIDDKIIYEYDFLQMHIFLLEVFDIVNVDAAPASPMLTYSEGQFETEERLKIENDPEKLKQELLRDFDNLDSDEDEDLGSWDDDD